MALTPLGNSRSHERVRVYAGSDYPCANRLFPHSGQNLVPRSDSAPHLAHTTGIVSFWPQFSQNFPLTDASAPQWGHSARCFWATLMSPVMSVASTLVLSCSMRACDCICRSSCYSLGASFTNMLNSVIQQISLQTHWPQRWHWLNSGATFCTASCSALSLACDSVRSLSWSAPYCAFQNLPPSIPPRPRVILAPTPSGFVLNPDL